MKGGACAAFSVSPLACVRVARVVFCDSSVSAKAFSWFAWFCFSCGKEVLTIAAVINDLLVSKVWTIDRREVEKHASQAVGAVVAQPRRYIDR